MGLDEVQPEVLISVQTGCTQCFESLVWVQIGLS